MPGQANELANKLFNGRPSEMSKIETDLLIEQYKLYVKTMEKVSERRHQANSFFLTANTFLIATLAGFTSVTRQSIAQYSWVVIAAIGGIVFCLTWRRLIRSYSQLNRGKLEIISLLETRLPARLFDAEWDALGHGDGTLYQPFTRAEAQIPIVFSVLYVALALGAILSPIL